MAADNKLQTLVGYHLRRASVFDLAGAVAALQPADTRPIMVSVLLCIAEQPGLTSSEVCRILGMQRANIVQFLVELEARGLLRREADRSDQRIQRLLPTAEGQDAVADWLARLQAHEDRMLSRLSENERSELCRLLGLIWAPGR